MSTSHDSGSELDPRAVERHVHELVNDERRDRQLGTLAFDEELAAVARSHSRDMAEREYVAHVSPEGADFSDRYTDAGYDCRVATAGNRYLQGGENVGKTYYEAPLEDGTYLESAAEVAAGLVRGWVNSPDHRKNLLTVYWNCEGVGVALGEQRGRTVVYATQNFC